MGSQSDYPVMKDAKKILKLLKINHEVLTVSAHRTPKRMFEFAENAANKGFAVIIAGGWRSRSFTWNGFITRNYPSYWSAD